MATVAASLSGTRRRLFQGLGGFFIRRLLLGLLTLFLVSIIVFAATQVLPSDPARAIRDIAASLKKEVIE